MLPSLRCSPAGPTLQPSARAAHSPPPHQVFTTAASDESPQIVRLAFDTVEKIVREHFHYITGGAEGGGWQGGRGQEGWGRGKAGHQRAAAPGWYGSAAPPALPQVCR